MFAFRQVFSRLIRLVNGKSHKLGYHHEEKAKNEFALKKLAYTVPFLINQKRVLLSIFLATTSSFMHDWSRHSILSQSRVPLYEKYITVIYELSSTHEEATLQNTWPLICISLNKNSNYCYIPRSSKHTDTCK